MRIASKNFIAVFEYCFNRCCYRTWWKEQGESFKILHDFKLPPRVEESYALLDCYAASSGNSFPTFRDSLSVPSSWVKCPRRVYPVTSATGNRTQGCQSIGIQVIQKSGSHPKILPARRVKLDGTWRKKTNYEVNYLIRSKNIINYIKALRMTTSYMSGIRYPQDQQDDEKLDGKII